MSFITTKFQENLLSSFRGVASTNCFSSILYFGQISRFKKGVTPRKRIESKFPVSKFKKGHYSQKRKIESKYPVNMRIYTLCLS